MAQSLLSYAVTCLQMQANSHKPVAQCCTEGKYKAVDLFSEPQDSLQTPVVLSKQEYRWAWGRSIGYS